MSRTFIRSYNRFASINGPTGPTNSQASSIYPFFRLPAVIDGLSFITLVRKQARALQRYDHESKESSRTNKAGMTRYPNSISQSDLDIHDPEWQPLTSHLTIPLLEHEIWTKRALKTDMLGTLLIPYAAAKELILERLPERYEGLAEQELVFEESILMSNHQIRKARAMKAEEASNGHFITLENRPAKAAATSTHDTVLLSNGGASTSSSSSNLDVICSNSLQAVPANKIIQYKDDDVYGDRRPMKEGLYRRLPIVCVMGHIDHGKTTLLDTLMASNMCAREAGKITQSVRCFTVDIKTCVGQLEGLNQRRRELKMQEGQLLTHAQSPDRYHSSDAPLNPIDSILPSRYATYPCSITFVDTPGHKAFAEMRFHSQLAADFVVLIVALDEGVLGQTLEVLHVALNMDRPIVVVFNKTDIFTDQRQLATAIVSAVQTLAKEGLKIKLVTSFDELEQLKKPTSQVNTSIATSIQRSSTKEELESVSLASSPLAPFLSRTIHQPSTTLDPSSTSDKKKSKQQSPIASMRNPVLESGKLKRRSLGICISGKSGANVDLLLEVLRCGAQLLNPKADASVSAKVQAQVLEASKTTEQTEQRELHGKFAGAASNNKPRPPANLSASGSDLQKEMAAQGAGGMSIASNAAERALRGYSTSQVIITAIVRSGTLKVGMPFVADQCYGVVGKLCDYWGRPLKFAQPGTAVVIIDDKSQSGCPGVGTHVIGVSSVEKAFAVNTLRRHLAWFIEAFPKRTELLRPKGMDTSFKAVGNFGQIDQKTSEKSLEYRLLYGGGKESEKSKRDSLEGLGSSNSVPKENKAAEAVAPSSTVEGTPAEIEGRWAALQLEKMPETKEEMENIQQNGKVIGIYCKVDSWHSARILQREIPRLSTKYIFFSVLGIKFGELKAEDTQDFINNCKVVICYRTPRLQCPKTYRHLELLNFYLLETDIYSEIVTYLKTVAIEEHEKYIKEKGSLEANRFAEATKSLLTDIGIKPTYSKRRGLQAITRPPSSAGVRSDPSTPQ